jgi:predicted SAM-dependent methyltransferase
MEQESKGFLQVPKRAVVRLIGRERANHLIAPYHDWLARRRTRSLLDALPASDLRINLGCGYSPMEGWINVDMARGPRVDIVWDLRRGLPFRNDSSEAIFSEHVIEHLPKEGAEDLVRECYRVLQPGGVLRLSTPDAGRFLRSYAGDADFLHHPEFSEAIETPLDRINMMMREGGQHLWTYDAASLLLLLGKVGFTSVVEQKFGESWHPQMQGIDSESRAFESLYVEGRK